MLTRGWDSVVYVCFERVAFLSVFYSTGRTRCVLGRIEVGLVAVQWQQ